MSSAAKHTNQPFQLAFPFKCFNLLHNDLYMNDRAYYSKMNIH